MSGYPSGMQSVHNAPTKSTTRSWLRRHAVLISGVGVLALSILLSAFIWWRWIDRPVDEQPAFNNANRGYERMYFTTQTALVVVQTAALFVVIYQLRESRRSATQQAMLDFLANRAQVDASRSERYDLVDRRLRHGLETWARSGCELPCEMTSRDIWRFWSFQFGQFRLYLDGHLDDARYRFFLGYRLSEAIQHDSLRFRPQLQTVYNAIVARNSRDFRDPSFERLIHLLVVQRVSADELIAYAQAERAKHWTGAASDLRVMADLMRRAGTP
jgi:hypothetical protein